MSKISRIVWAVAACVVLPLAFAHVCALTYVLAKRLTYPMDLEWLEGQQIYEAYRFIHGLPIYGPPTQGFVPSPYPPVHFMVMGLVGLVAGLDYWTGHFVSDAAIASVLAMQALVFFRSTSSRGLAAALATIAAAGVYVAFPVLGGSFDYARSDSLAFALVVGVAMVVRRSRMTWGAVVGLAALITLAVYAKQNNVLYCTWLLLWLARRDLRQAIRAAIVSALFGGAALAALQVWTHGWFWMWLTEMSHHPFVLSKWKAATTFSITGAPLLVIVPFLAAGLWWKRSLRDDSKLWLGMLLMSIPACLVPYLADGGAVNNLITVTVLGWFVPLLLIGDLLHALAPRPALASFVALGASVGLMVVLWTGFRDPKQWVPNATQRRDVEAMHTLIRGLDGDVLLAMYPFVVPRDGKTTPQPAIIPYLDAANRGGVKIDIPATFRALRAKWVVLCGHELEDFLLKAWLGEDYVVDRELPLHVQAFAQQTGRSMILLRRVDSH